MSQSNNEVVERIKALESIIQICSNRLRLIYKEVGILSEDERFTFLEKTICDYFKITVINLSEKKRNRHVNIYPRFFLWLFVKTELGWSLNEIGMRAGMFSHASILHGINELCVQINIGNKEISKMYEELLTKIELKADVKKIKRFVEGRENQRNPAERKPTLRPVSNNERPF